MLEQGAIDALGDELRARLLVERLRLGEIDLRGDAGIDLVLHDLQRAAVGRQRFLEQPAARVGDAQRDSSW